MELSEMQQAVEALRNPVREDGCWTKLVLRVCRHMNLPRPASVVDSEMKMVAAINIARAIKPISMRSWTTGRTLDWLDHHL